MILDENLQGILNSDLNATSRFSGGGQSYAQGEVKKHRHHEGGKSNADGQANTTHAVGIPVDSQGITSTPAVPAVITVPVTAPIPSAPTPTVNTPNYTLILGGLAIGGAAGYLLGGQYIKTEKLFGLKKEYAGAVIGAIALGIAGYYIGNQIAAQNTVQQNA